MMLEARRRAQAAVREVAGRITPGMLEDEGLGLTRRTLRAHGFDRDWAEPCLRFGRNTLKRFGEPSEPGAVLGRDDVWIIDVGPVWQGWECDVGDTFVVGADPERLRLVRDLHGIFDGASRRWREQRATGAELYRFAVAEAASRGWRLDLDMGGHRIGEYPLAAIDDGTLARADFTPPSGFWMLEIQLRHPALPYSAFFEDLLLD